MYEENAFRGHRKLLAGKAESGQPASVDSLTQIEQVRLAEDRKNAYP
jgi:hypothetical protein